jgi:glycerol-3-phosphate dehydrogenase
LTFSWALAAAAHGAVLANHVEAVSVAKEGRRVAGVSCVDRLSGRTIDVAARIVVNATGGAIDSLLASIGISTGIPMLKAMNLVTTRDAGDAALGGRSGSGRNLFLVPWRRRALFGTWESRTVCTPDQSNPTEQEVASFITELNEAFPALDLQRSDVSLVHRGVVPAAKRSSGVALEGRPQIRDHAGDGVEGLFSVAGTKYTTARAVAQDMVDAVVRTLPGTYAPCRTAATPLPGGHVRDVALAIAEARRDYDDLLPSDTIPHLVAGYGSGYREVADLARSHPEWSARLAKDSPVIGAELIWAVRHEMAETLVDAVVRRTPLGALGDPGDAASAAAAQLMAAERRWTEDRKQRELEGLKQFYRSANG